MRDEYLTTSERDGLQAVAFSFPLYTAVQNTAYTRIVFISFELSTVYFWYHSAVY